LNIQSEQVGHCEQHGDYKRMEQEFMGKIMFVGRCKQCEAESEEKEALKAKKEASDTAIRKRDHAGITKRYLNKTFESYVSTTEKQQSAKDKFIKLSEAIKNGSGFNIIATGKPGTGKTLLACALIDSLVDQKRVKLIKLIDLIRDLKETWNRDSQFTEREIIDSLTKLDLLIIDEIGLQFGSDTERLFIFDVIDGRYQAMLPTVLMSNLAIKGKGGVEECIGERVLDRLREDGGVHVVFDWESQR